MYIILCNRNEIERSVELNDVLYFYDHKYVEPVRPRTTHLQTSGSQTFTTAEPSECIPWSVEPQCLQLRPKFLLFFG